MRKKSDRGAVLADGQQPERARRRDRLDRRDRLPVRVGVDDGARAARQDRLEQAELRRAIGRVGAVIVEMVAGEIGEARRPRRDPVEPSLGEAVRGGFHRDPGHAGRCEQGERRGEAHRIGRRQHLTAVHRDAGRRDEAERAERRGPLAGKPPELAAELGGRGLAVRPRDRDQCLGRRSGEYGCEAGEGR